MASVTFKNIVKKFGDVIAHATEGKVTLDQLKNLTDADATVVAAAVARLVS